MFISPAGTRLLYCNVHATWKLLVAARRAASRARRHAGPRIHDLRHTFAVRSLLDAYAAGQDGQARWRCWPPISATSTPAATYWYLSAAPRAARPRPGSGSSATWRPAVTALAPTLQAFFTDRLIRQRHASPHTIAAYRDTWRLLLAFAARTHRQAAHPSSTSPTWTRR